MQMPLKKLNRNRQAATAGKNNGFYTQLTDIEREADAPSPKLLALHLRKWCKSWVQLSCLKEPLNVKFLPGQTLK